MLVTILLVVASSCIANGGSWHGKLYGNIRTYQDTYLLPDLPYKYTALQPYIDGKTLRVHHLGHHQAYTDKMNKLLKEWRREESSGLAHTSIVEVLQKVRLIPERWRTLIINQGGGYVNHLLYFTTMCVGGKGPSEKLVKDIERDFGSFDVFHDHFTTLANSVFGSGYTWLCEDKDGKLQITTTANQDTPLSQGLYPLLVIDLWEHSYYLEHQNKRSDYIDKWWNVVCWDEVDELREFWYAPLTDSSHTEL